MTLSEIFDAIRRLILSLAEKGWSTKQIDEAVADFLAQNNLEREMSREMQRLAMQEWVSKRTLTQQERKIVQRILNIAGNQFARVADKIREGVVEVIERSRDEDISLKETKNLLISELDGKKHWAQTVAVTAKSAFSSANTVSRAEEVGINKLRYAGPPAQRPFCQLHLGNVYTLKEIRQMDNGQGLPVLYYRGGYNCRHRWVVDFSAANKNRKFNEKLENEYFLPHL